MLLDAEGGVEASGSVEQGAQGAVGVERMTMCFLHTTGNSNSNSGDSLRRYDIKKAPSQRQILPG